VLRHEIGVLAHAVTGALDLHDHGMMEEPVEQRGGDNRIAEDVTPFGKAAIGGEDHRAFFVAGVDELEEQVAAARGDRQVADFVNHQQRTAAQEAYLLAQDAFTFGFGQDGDEVGQRDEVDAFAGANGLDGERNGEMGFSGARRGRDMVPGTRGRTRRFTTLFIRIAGGELQLCGVIRFTASRCW
jgi:hypothetical protein